MKRVIGQFILAISLVLSAPAMARGHSYGRHHSIRSYSTRRHSSPHSRSSRAHHPRTGQSPSYSSSGHHRSGYAAGAHRDRHGRVMRSSAAKHQFEKSYPCPSTGRTSGSCPGYVIDHVTPLQRGGTDAQSNMQWQTKDAAKAKDKWE